MALEIERKFIVPLQMHAMFVGREGGEHQVQAYLSDDPARTVRVRITESPSGTSAKMTVKGKPRHGGIAKPEWEWSMPVDMVAEMISELNPPYLDKTRHIVNFKGATWEVDVLKVENRPSKVRYIVTAEVEMPSIEAARAVAIPPWVGREVTGDKRYAMSMLTTEEARHLAYKDAYIR